MIAWYRELRNVGHDYEAATTIAKRMTAHGLEVRLAKLALGEHFYYVLRTARP